MKLGLRETCDDEVLYGYAVVRLDQLVSEARDGLDGPFLYSAVLLSETFALYKGLIKKS